MSTCKKSIEQEIRTLEEKLLNPAIRKSAEELSILIADDFMEFGSSGQTYNKQQVIDGLLKEKEAKYEIVDICVKKLGPEVALATYQAIRYYASREIHSLRSSIWRMNNGRWQLVFHQGTPVNTAFEGD